MYDAENWGNLKIASVMTLRRHVAALVFEYAL
jgi:hypothetical protein